MPTYEYHCDACGHEFEIVQRITEDPIKKCPKCKKPKAHRLIVGGNFILKGSGWYADGYSGGGAKSEKKEGSGSTESKSSETKTDPKSEKKEEKKKKAGDK